MRSMIALARKFLALRPPARLQLRLLRWIASTVMREFPWQLAVGGAVAIGVALALGALESTGGAALLAALGAAELVLLRFSWLSFRSAAAVRGILDELAPERDGHSTRFPRSHMLIPPLMLVPRGVRRHRGIEYARVDGRRLCLDAYLPAGPVRGRGLRPAIVQVHGGGWIAGTRTEQGIPLLNHLAVNGWVGFNIDYRLSPRATFPDHVADVKRAIAWAREHAAEFAVDPERISITGGSAGGHLSALAALTVGDRELQPGFEDADTSVAAAVPFYGVYDLTDTEGLYYAELREWVLEQHVFKARMEDEPERFRAASPTHRVHPDAPPFLVIHGAHDTLVTVTDARRFVERLRAQSHSPVLYAELEGAEHAFDILPTMRTARVVETIERFLTAIDRRAAIAPAGAIG
jgi:acetyl esterase/lipase